MAWGISGPQFLVLYLAGLVAALGWAWSVRRQARRPPEPQPAQQVGLAELAFLAGGPRRVVEAALARLVQEGQVHASREGRLTAAETTAGSSDPVETAVLGQIGSTPRPVGAVIGAVAGSRVVTGIGDHLVARQLLVAPAAAASARRRAVLGLGLLAVVGLLRLLNGVRVGAAVEFLALLLAGTGFLIFRLYRRRIPARTVYGDRVLASVRREGLQQYNRWLHPAVALAGVGGAVALGGLMAFPDAAVRGALLQGNATAMAAASGTSSGCSSCSSWSYSDGGGYSSCGSSGSSGSSDGSSSGCGSSCGGGGCGGGCGS